MRLALLDRAMGILHALIGAALGAILLPALFMVFVFVQALQMGTAEARQFAQAVFNVGLLLGVVGVFAGASAFGFALVMATVVHDVLRRFRMRSIFSIVLAGLSLYGAAASTLMAGGFPASHHLLFFPVAVPSVLLGSLFLARRMRRSDARAGDPWP